VINAAAAPSGETSKNCMSSRRLILASSSPRRRELLHAAGYAFEVHPADADEDDYPLGTAPADLALFLARVKARTVAERFPADVVLAADTVVAFGDEPLGKPTDAADAARMLSRLSGTTHVVITGVCVVSRKTEQVARVMSSVTMKTLSPEEIADYVATNDWQGKAGGYGIQDEGSDRFIIRATGSRTNIVGLPMDETIALLAAVGVLPGITTSKTEDPIALSRPSS
jgi:septum formation protein